MEDPSFTYVMLRLLRLDPGEHVLSGILERIGSGERRAFATAGELVRMLDDMAHTHVEVAMDSVSEEGT